MAGCTLYVYLYNFLCIYKIFLFLLVINKKVVTVWVSTTLLEVDSWYLSNLYCHINRNGKKSLKKNCWVLIFIYNIFRGPLGNFLPVKGLKKAKYVWEPMI